MQQLSPPKALLALGLTLVAAVLAVGWILTRSPGTATSVPLQPSIQSEEGVPIGGGIDPSGGPTSSSQRLDAGPRRAPSMGVIAESDGAGSRVLRAAETRPDGPQLVGQLVDEDGDPVALAECWFSTDRRYQDSGVPLGLEAPGESSGHSVARCESDEAGRFQVSGRRHDPAAGELPLAQLRAGGELAGWIRKPGFAPRRIGGVTVSTERPHDLGEVVLERAAVISGRVELASGKPVPGAKLTLHQPLARGSVVWHTPGRGMDVGETDADGRFRCEELRAGAFELMVDTPFSPTFTHRGVALVAAVSPDIRIRVGLGASVSGRVLGLPVGRRVLIEAQQLASECGGEGPLRPRRGPVDPGDGSFAVTGLVPKGPVWLTAVEAEPTAGRPAGAAVREIQGVMSVAGLESAILEWQPRATGRGRVLVPRSGGGDPVPLEVFTVSVGVAPSPESPFPARSLTDGGAPKRHHPAGRFEFDGAALLGSQDVAVNLRIRAAGYRELVRMGVPMVKGQVTDFGDLRLTPETSLRVRVVDLESRRPLRGARLFLAGVRWDKALEQVVARRGPCWGNAKVGFAESEGGGVGELAIPAPGFPCRLVVQADGYLDSEPILVQGPSEEVLVELARGATVLVRATTRGKAPIAGVPVRLIAIDELKQASYQGVRAEGSLAVTNRSGEAVFHGIRGGAYMASAMPPETVDPAVNVGTSPFAWPEKGVQVPESGEAVVELKLGATVDFEGTVLLTGEGLAEARVTLHVRHGTGISSPPDGPSALRAVTDSTGRFQFKGVPPYGYLALVEHTSRATATPSHVRVEEGMGPVLLELPNTRVSGRVVFAETGEPVEGAKVTLAARNLPEAKIKTGYLRRVATGGAVKSMDVATPGQARTDLAGYFEFEGVVTRRSIWLEVEADGATPARKKLKTLSQTFMDQDVRIELERREEQEEK